MSRSLAALVIVALLAGSAAVFLLGQDSTAPGPTEAETRGRPAVTREASAAEAEPAGDPVAAARSGGARTDIFRSPAAPDDTLSPSRLRVLVQRSVDGTPATEATVHWLPAGTSFQSVPITDSFLAFARDRGESARTDSQGAVEIEYASSTFNACAITDDGWIGRVSAPSGWRRGPADGDLVLVVEPDVTFDLVVRAQSGDPVPLAGVNVFAPGFSYPFARVRTDEAGRTTLQHAQAYVDGGTLSVRPAAWGADGPEVTLSVSAPRPSSEPIALELPPTGEVLVRVLPQDAERLGVDVRAVSPMIEIAEEDPNAPRVFGPGLTSEETCDERGIARLRPVAAAEMLRAKVRFADLEAVFEGPSRAGAVTEVDLRADWTTRIVARCRVLAPSGEPLANARLTLR
ncbi:MAG: hypothetical protein AAFP86_10545, partial [Planctomycetota bacterium]